MINRVDYWFNIAEMRMTKEEMICRIVRSIIKNPDLKKSCCGH